VPAPWAGSLEPAIWGGGIGDAVERSPSPVRAGRIASRSLEMVCESARLGAHRGAVVQIAGSGRGRGSLADVLMARWIARV